MKSIKKGLVILLLVSMVGAVFTGCTTKQTVVATINGQNVSEQLYRIFLWSAQRGLESLQPDFWELDSIEGKTPEEYAKEKALKSISYCIVVGQKAKELNVKLTDEEKTKIKAAAKEAAKQQKVIADEYHIKQKDYEAYYTYATQDEKVRQILGESYEPNEEEIAAMIKTMEDNGEIQQYASMIHVLINTKDELGGDLPSDMKQAAYKEAQEVLEKALAGEDMSILARTYSDDASVESNNGAYTFKKGTMEQAIEEVVFEPANTGRVYPEIIETSMGYEIIQVISIDGDSIQEIRENAIEAIKSNFASEELNQMCNLAEVKKAESYDAIHKMNLNEISE